MYNSISVNRDLATRIVVMPITGLPLAPAFTLVTSWTPVEIFPRNMTITQI